MSAYRIEVLGRQDRSRFACGASQLDRYFREQVMQDVKRRVASCFIALDADDTIAGYYTLAATSIALDRLAPEKARKLPRYPLVPGVLLGRLAVATAHQGRKLGVAMVADAVLRSNRSDVTGHLLIVDAKDAPAARFYERLGFQPLGSEPRRMVLAL